MTALTAPQTYSVTVSLKASIVPRANTTTTELKDAAPAGGPAISARPGPSARTAETAGAWTKTTTANAPAKFMISLPQNA